MAIVDYRCKECGRAFFEIVNKVNEKINCPECNSISVERIYKGKYYGKGSSCGGNCSSGCSGCSCGHH